MSRHRSSCGNNQLLIAHIMSKIIFMNYLPPVTPEMVPKLKMLRIYWSLALVIFRTSQSRSQCHLFVPNCPQNKKCSEFIETWHILYFKYTSINLMSKMIFIKYLPPAGSKLVPKSKMLRIYWNLIKIEIW